VGGGAGHVRGRAGEGWMGWRGVGIDKSFSVGAEARSRDDVEGAASGRISVRTPIRNLSGAHKVNRCNTQTLTPIFFYLFILTDFNVSVQLDNGSR